MLVLLLHPSFLYLPQTGDPELFRSGLFLSSLFLEFSVTLLERVDAAFSIDHRLLTREIGMARGAGVDLHFLLRGTRLDDIAARARNRRVFVGRMDSVFHLYSVPFKK